MLEEMQLSKQVTHAVAPQVRKASCRDVRCKVVRDLQIVALWCARKEVLSQALAPFVEPAVLVSLTMRHERSRNPGIRIRQCRAGQFLSSSTWLRFGSDPESLPGLASLCRSVSTC